MLKRIFLNSSKVYRVAKPRFAGLTAARIAQLSSATPSYVGFKASRVDESTKIDAHFNKDHFVLQYQATDKNLAVNKDFPYVWLRDRCRCSECFNRKTQENDLTPFDLTPLDMAPLKACFERNTINVTCKSRFRGVRSCISAFDAFISQGRMDTNQHMIWRNLPRLVS